MSAFVERRKTIWLNAAVLAVMFGLGTGFSLVTSAAPTWQNHGPSTGPGLIRLDKDPFSYYMLTGTYAVIAVVSTWLVFYTLPWVTLNHIRLAFLTLFLLLIIQFLIMIALMPSKPVIQRDVRQGAGILKNVNR